MLDAVGLKSLFAPVAGQGRIRPDDAGGLVSVWQFVGIPMMLIYAALLSIPEEILEAGEIDGITGASAFWKIKLPLILPSIGIISILTFVGNFNAFRPDLCVSGRAGRAGFLDRYPWHLHVPHLLWLPTATGRPAYGIGYRRGHVRHHSCRCLHLPVRHPDPDAPVSAVRTMTMNKARHNPLNTAAMHGALILYTLIALFPVFVIIINSFKTRRAIFREPLALPDAESFSLIGYQTVMKQGDFLPLFPELADRHRRVADLYPFVWGHGRLCA